MIKSFNDRLQELADEGTVKTCEHCGKVLTRGRESESRQESWNSFLARKFCDKQCKTAARDAYRRLDDEIPNIHVNCLRCGKKLIRNYKTTSGYPEDAHRFQFRKYCDRDCYRGSRL